VICQGPAACAAILGFLAQAVIPEPPEATWKISTEFDTSSRYVWRGLEVSPNPVLQVSASLASGATSVTLWGNLRSDNSTTATAADEVDITFTRKLELGNLSLEFGSVGYLYPGQQGVSPTAEATIRLIRAWGDFELAASLAVDYLDHPLATYGELSASISREVGRSSLDGTVTLGLGSGRFNSAYVGLSRRGLNQVSLDIGASFDLGGGSYIRPHLGFSSLLDSQLRRSVERPDLLSFGVAVGIEF
jgi:hypothetical protein